MKLTMLILADYAALEPETGKININGAFTQVHTNLFPVLVPPVYVVIRLAADDPTETTAERNFELRLTDADGKVLFQISYPVMLKRDQRGNRPYIDMIGKLPTIEFPDTGIYEIVVYIDGEKIGDTWIELLKYNRDV